MVSWTKKRNMFMVNDCRKHVVPNSCCYADKIISILEVNRETIWWRWISSVLLASCNNIRSVQIGRNAHVYGEILKAAGFVPPIGLRKVNLYFNIKIILR